MRVIFLAFALLAACDIAARDEGERLFSDRSLSESDTNVFSCATCHDKQASNRLSPGYPMAGVASRAAFWGGNVPSLLQAVNECVTSFMRANPIGRTEPRGRALFVYLESLDTGAPTPPLPLTVVRDIVDVPSGDATTGKDIYERACSRCHGQPVSGQGRISPRQSILPTATIESFGTDPVSGARPITIEKVRHGKFYGIGGDMPLFAIEMLSDEQLGHVLAYLETFGLPPSPTR